MTKEIFLNLKQRKHTLEVNKSIVYIFNLYSVEQCETVKWAWGLALGFWRYKPGVGNISKGHIETMVRCHIFYLKKKKKNMPCKLTLNCFWLYDWSLNAAVDLRRWRCVVFDFFLVNSLLSCVSSKPAHPLSLHSLSLHGPWCCSGPLIDQWFPVSLMWSHRESHAEPQIKWLQFFDSVRTYWLVLDSMKVYSLTRFLSTSNCFSLYT